MKVSEAFAEYRKNEIIALNKSAKTNEGYVYAEKITVKYFGDINVRHISLEKIHDFYIWMVRNHSKNTARDYVCKLRVVLNYCSRKGIRVVNPDLIKTPKREKKEARYITCNEFARFVETVEQPHRGYSKLNRTRNVIIVEMLFYTGLRISELCALNRDSIKNRQFSVVGKSKNPRPCYITKQIESDITEYLNSRNDDNPALFISGNNGKRITPSNVQFMFRGFSKKSGVFSVTPHTLRHSYATRMVEDGVDIRYVKELLGHQSLETTQRYTHIRDFRLKQIYENVMENG